MSDRSFARRYWLFWLAVIVWLATAIPIALFSLLTLEMPLWPTFSEESTREGTAIWAIITAWFYITRLILVVVRRQRRIAASKRERC